MISTAWRLPAVLGLPLAPVEPAVDRNRAALGEVVGAVLALRAPDGDVEVVGLVDPLAALAVLAAAVDGHAKLADRVPLGVERSSGSLVRFPVITTTLMFGLPQDQLLFLSVPNAILSRRTAVLSPGGEESRKLRERVSASNSSALARRGRRTTLATPRRRLREAGARRRGRDRRCLGIDPEDPEAQHSVGDLEAVVELLEQFRLGPGSGRNGSRPRCAGGSRRRACARPRCRRGRAAARLDRLANVVRELLAGLVRRPDPASRRVRSSGSQRRATIEVVHSRG